MKITHFITTILGLTLSLGLVVGALNPQPVAADYTPQPVTFDPNSNTERNTGLGNANPIEITQRVIQWVLSVLALLALALVIYAGFIWLLSRGNEEEIGRAKGILEGALFGLIVILASYGITSYVFENLINVTNNT